MLRIQWRTTPGTAGVWAAVLGVESALYSILTYMSAARTLDFIIHGLEEYNSITIMSSQADFIRRVS